MVPGNDSRKTEKISKSLTKLKLYTLKSYKFFFKLHSEKAYILKTSIGQNIFT
jgi:hypothetical protein